MIALDELLIKIGVDGEQAQQISSYVDLLQNGADNIGANTEAINNKLDSLLNDVSDSLSGASDAASQATQGLNQAGQSAEKAESKFSKLKIAAVALVAGVALFGNKIASAFNSAIDNAENLFQSKNSLFEISKKEIDQVGKYKQSLDKTSLSIDSIKTKIAINLIPSLTAVSEKFNSWLVINKDFISNGISKVILWLGKGMQVITNFIKFIDKVIRSTIGWKNAFIALGVAWAVLNRKFLMSPVGMLVAAFSGLLLLIDDLMVYLEGGESLFGSYWDPLIDGTKSIIEWFNSLSETTQQILGVGGVIGVAILSLGSTALKVGGLFVRSFKMMGVAVRALTAAMMSNPILAAMVAIATVAYLIYDNWDWLSAQFKKIWANISGFATEAWNSIILTVSNAIKEVLMWFGLTETEADAVVSAIGSVFMGIFGFIAAPFKAAYDFVTALFSIWGDDSTSVVDKFGKSFSLVKDLITSPFKKAMAWIQDKFMGFIDGILGTVKKALSYIGIEIDIGENKEIDYGGDEYRIKDPSSIQRSDLENIQNFASRIGAPNVPSPNNSDNRVTNNSMEAKTNITVNVNGNSEGANRAGDLYQKSLENANNNFKRSIGG